MVRIDDSIEAVRQSQLRISDHADEEAQADTLTFDEIFFSVLQASKRIRMIGPIRVALSMGIRLRGILCIASGRTTKTTVF